MTEEFKKEKIDGAEKGMLQIIPVIRDFLTFQGRQMLHMEDMEKRTADQLKRKELQWKRSLEKMKEEFIQLQPCIRSGTVNGRAGGSSGGGDGGSKTPADGEALDVKKMRTVLVDWSYPNELIGEEEKSDGSFRRRSASCNGSYEDSERSFHLRFDVSEFDPQSVRVTSDSTRITVYAEYHELRENGTKLKRKFCRKILKPKELNEERMKSYLLADGILIVTAPFLRRRHQPPCSAHDKTCTADAATSDATSAAVAAICTTGKMSHSISHTSHHSRVSKSSKNSKKSASSSTGSPGTTPTLDKFGVPVFRVDEKGVRRLQLTVELGSPFTPDDIIVQVIKENKIQVIAKHKVITEDKLSKTKFLKEYDLGESIETYSLKGGFTSEGKLIVQALAKGHGKKKK